MKFPRISSFQVKSPLGYIGKRRPDVIIYKSKAAGKPAMLIKRRPGEVRDAIISFLQGKPEGASLSGILDGVRERLGAIQPSSVRSYLRLNTPMLFERNDRGHYSLKPLEIMPDPNSHESSENLVEIRQEWPSHCVGKSKLIHADCFEWLRAQPPNSIHAVVTDPPYSLLEYTPEQQQKLRSGRGGVWRIPPSFDGVVRSPLPRFTVLSDRNLAELETFF